MINPIQSIYLNHYSYKSSVPQGSQQDSGQLQDLSGYTVGQAILVRNNISFRGCAEPIDVTPLYNKRIEGKDHLDLPNIHVYEFPDTNLQAIVNVDENSLLSKSIMGLVVQSQNFQNDVILDNLLYQILKAKSLDKNILLTGGDSQLCYYKDQNSDNTLNKLIFSNRKNT